MAQVTRDFSSTTQRRGLIIKDGEIYNWTPSYPAVRQPPPQTELMRSEARRSLIAEPQMQGATWRSPPDLTPTRTRVCSTVGEERLSTTQWEARGRKNENFKDRVLRGGKWSWRSGMRSGGLGR